MLRTKIATTVLSLAAGAFAVAAVRVAARQEPPQPTAEHAWLLRGVGDWQGTLTTSLPDVPSEPIPVTETVEAVGGFWTQSRFECEFMGAPFVGTGCLGYDTQRKKFVGTWIDSSSSYLSVMEGERDPKTQELVMRWQAPDMMTGALAPHRYVSVERKDGSHETTFYMGAGDAEVKTMVISMKRKSAQATEAGAGR